MRIPLLAVLFLSMTTTVGSMSTRHGRTLVEARLLSLGCEVFRELYGDYPPADSWFDELRGTSSAMVNTNSHEFVTLKASVDAWDNRYVYKLPGKHNPDSFDLYSKGADGVSASGGNDPDDIGGWHETRRVLAYYEPPLIAPLWRVNWIDITYIVCSVGAGALIIRWTRAYWKPKKDGSESDALRYNVQFHEDIVTPLDEEWNVGR